MNKHNISETNSLFKGDDSLWDYMRGGYESAFSVVDCFFQDKAENVAKEVEEAFEAGCYDVALDLIQSNQRFLREDWGFHYLCGVCRSYLFHNKLGIIDKNDKSQNSLLAREEECLSLGESTIKEFKTEIEIIEVFDVNKDYKEALSETYLAMADIYSCLNKPLDKYRCLMAVCPNTSFYDIAQKALKRLQNDLNNSTSDLCIFLENDIDYFQRQFLFVARNNDDLAGWYDDKNIAYYFPINSLPAISQFPIGHPQPNSLYFAHPAKSWFYVPFEEASQWLFDEKVRDFIRLVQCLGATEVRFRAIKGLSTEAMRSAKFDIEAGGEYGGRELQGAYGYKMEEMNQNAQNLQKESVYHFYPSKAPYIPDDIVWLQSDPEWQSLLKLRMEGDLTHYSIRISSRKTMSVSDSRMDSVKAAFNGILTKVNGSVSLQMQQSSRKEEETEWEFNVNFKSLADYIGQGNQEKTFLSKSEQEYLENIKEFYSDDSEITPRERKMLDRIRQSLGISEERGFELEASLKPQLTEDEREYLEMYREYAKKGEITEKERRRLEKFAGALNIPSNRIIELENL